MRWIGVRSYGIYLWHWPVFMVTRPGLDVRIDGLPLLALRLSATVLLAHLSYRYIETPIRRGALGRAWKKLREAQGPRRWQLRLQWAGALVPILASCALLGVAVAQAKPPEKPSYLASMKSVHTVEHSQQSSFTTGIDRLRNNEPSPEEGGEKAPVMGPGDKAEIRNTLKTDESEGMLDEDSRENGVAPGAKAEETKKSLDSGRTGPSEFTGSVSAIGDSVLLGAVGGLQKVIQGLAVVDAEVGLQVYAAIDTLKYRRATGQLGEVVIVHLGNNGTREEFDQIMQTLSGVDNVLFVNVKVPRAWEEPNNEVIAEGVKRYPNAVLVDWYSASADRPELYYSDGYHLRPEGQQIYTDLISSHLPEE
jgi:hypothetical protein